MRAYRYFSSDSRKAPHLYNETLTVKNWRTVYRSKYALLIGSKNQAEHVEQFIERLLLNTTKQVLRGMWTRCLTRCEAIAKGWVTLTFVASGT